MGYLEDNDVSNRPTSQPLVIIMVAQDLAWSLSPYILWHCSAHVIVRTKLKYNRCVLPKKKRVFFYLYLSHIDILRTMLFLCRLFLFSQLPTTNLGCYETTTEANNYIFVN